VVFKLTVQCVLSMPLIKDLKIFFHSAQYLRRHELTNYIDTTAKRRHLKKFTCKGTFAAGLYPSEAPSPSNFVGSECGQIQSVILRKNMVSNRAQYPHPPQPHCLIYCTLAQGRGGGLNQREGKRGAVAHDAGSKIPT
jgi:hypothetical protein